MKTENADKTSLSSKAAGPLNFLSCVCVLVACCTLYSFFNPEHFEPKVSYYELCVDGWFNGSKWELQTEAYCRVDKSDPSINAITSEVISRFHAMKKINSSEIFEIRESKDHAFAVHRPRYKTSGNSYEVRATGYYNSKEECLTALGEAEIKVSKEGRNLARLAGDSAAYK